MQRPQHATHTRLLDAALDAFSERGFEGASIRDITRRVGIRESGFYAHFASKREAYEELLALAGPAVATRRHRIVGRTASTQVARDLLARCVCWRSRRVAHNFGWCRHRRRHVCPAAGSLASRRKNQLGRARRPTRPCPPPNSPSCSWRRSRPRASCFSTAPPGPTKRPAAANSWRHTSLRSSR